MLTILSAMLSLVSFRFRRRASLELEVLVLRHQVAVCGELLIFPESAIRHTQDRCPPRNQTGGNIRRNAGEVVEREMHKMKQGTLKSGRSGKKGQEPEAGNCDCP